MQGWPRLMSMPCCSACLVLYWAIGSLRFGGITGRRYSFLISKHPSPEERDQYEDYDDYDEEQPWRR